MVPTEAVNNIKLQVGEGWEHPTQPLSTFFSCMWSMGFVTLFKRPMETDSFPNSSITVDLKLAM